MKFDSRIAGRFYAEFFFYLAVFILSLYYALQHQQNPWITVLFIFSSLFMLDMSYILYKNYLRSQSAFVQVDSDRIVIADEDSSEKVSWKDVEKVQIAWFSKDKWLERLFGLEPSILIKKKSAPKGEFEVGVSPDYFPTEKILAEMQRLHRDKIYLS